jgi:uncharacterized membrane protein YtjA (UPF0391 family)
MLHFTLATLFVALITGSLGFGANPSVASDLGKMLFLVFIQLSLIGVFCLLVATRLPRPVIAQGVLQRAIGINS